MMQNRNLYYRFQLRLHEIDKQLTKGTRNGTLKSENPLKHRKSVTSFFKAMSIFLLVVVTQNNTELKFRIIVSEKIG